jgi:ABC-type multidrug transport system ATPase subunit
MDALVAVEGLCVSHWRGLREIKVLRDVSFELYAGEIAGVWGRRGAGKTTLALAVAGLLEPQQGTVTFDGHDLRFDQAGELHARIGLASRRGPEVEDMPVGAWIASTLLRGRRWREARRQALSALDRVGAAALADMRWEHLSDGERMLASIAQAIVRGPRLVIADDPVAGVGGKDRADIMELLRSLTQDGTTVLVMAADLSELHGVDQIWALDRGRLDGPPRRPAARVVPLRSNSG